LEPLQTRRFLTSFDTSLMAQVFRDVLVIGSGIAGARAALAAAEHAEVLMISKGLSDDNNTANAQGGIACAIGPNDTPLAHKEDTIVAGQGLCTPEIVDTITSEGPERVREMIEWGAAFDKENGEIALTFEGGHSAARIAHALGDATGRELEDTLLRTVRNHPRIRVIENAFVLDLLTRNGGDVIGAVIQDQQRGRMVVWARQTILATGGCGRIFRETTNPAVATGDGLAMAWRAGAELSDMEFYQFHPTAFYVAGAPRKLISEAVRGEGAYLLNARHERFMPNYHERAELAPRDAVSRAIVCEIRETGHTSAYLDMRHIPASRLEMRFPAIRGFCAQYDIDIATDLVPIRPAAHYHVGGIRVDVNGRTSLGRLFACGEVSTTGLHGANRLGSNSLLEGLVIGARAGELAGRAAAEEEGDVYHMRISHQVPPERHAGVDVHDVTNALRAVCWRNLGIERSRFGLEEAMTMMHFWSRYVMDVEFADESGWQLQNMLLIACLLAEAALAREESRGVHFRIDFPDRSDDEWLCHLIVQRGHENRILPLAKP
jgi:L-aspartate oxidase